MANVSMSLKAAGLGLLRNRVAMSSLTRCRADNEGKVPNELMAEYYAQRAGDAGLIVAEGTHISKQGTGWADVPGIYTEEQAEGWKKVTEAVHAKGGKIVVQLWHQGRISHESFTGEGNVVAPSSVPAKGQIPLVDGNRVELPVPRELTLEEIPVVVEQFRAAAALARKAGFDGVEIQGDAGYLVGQFLYSKTNLRTDQYGGSIENRLRFMEDVIKAVLKELPCGQVGIKLTPNATFNDMGSPDFHEVTDAALKCIATHKLAFIHFSDGTEFGWHGFGAPYTLEEAMKAIKAVQGRDKQTILIGNMGYTHEKANRALGAGHADMISFGRQYITNPDLAERFQKGWPLCEETDRDTWWYPGRGKKGYTTYQPYGDTVLIATAGGA
jgi:N-ethylmaleimide reductase